MSERSTITGLAGGQPRRLAGMLGMLSRRPDLSERRGLFQIALVLRIAAAGLLGWIGYIHWHLWQEGYKFLPTNGPLFLVDAIAAVLLGLVLLAWPRPLGGLLATGFSVATIGALVISLSVGLFGFQESIHASFVVQSLILESIAAIILATWTVITVFAVPRVR